MILKALLYGVIITIVGTLGSFIAKQFLRVDLPPVCENWNKNMVMEASLFLTGFIAYYVIKYMRL
jgi:hypothetical protein